MFLVAKRAAVCALYIGAGLGRFAVRILISKISVQRTPIDQIAGRTLAEVFESLGPTYLKLGQLLATRRDILPPAIIEHLGRLLDQLPPVPIGHLHKAWQDDFGMTACDALERLEGQPVASGSIASVYRGRLKNGPEVAIKVLRPDVLSIVKADSRLIRILASIVGCIPGLRQVPLRGMADEFLSCVWHQLDFGREAEASERLRKGLIWESGVIIPKLILPFCGRSIITMEFINDIGDRAASRPVRRRAALRSALQALYRMLFVEGIFHCDLHPGNLHLLPSGKAVILDFGFTSEFSDQDRLKFAAFFYAFATGQGRQCAHLSLEMATHVPTTLDKRAFEIEILNLVEKVHDARVEDFQVALFVANLFDIQRRHRVRSTIAFAMAAIALMVFEGMIKQIDPELKFQRMAEPFIFRASVRGYRPEPATG
jgi:ubiquinone biosynthesis protein